MKRITTISIHDERTGRISEIRCLQCRLDLPCASISDGLDECEFYAVHGGIEYCALNDEE